MKNKVFTPLQRINHFLVFICFPVGVTISSYISVTEAWHQIEINTKIVEYLEGDGYAFIMLSMPFVYIQTFPRYKKFEKYLPYIVMFFFIGGLLITPRLLDYITEQKLLAKGYIYCESERIGSIRHMKKIWHLNTPCEKKKEKKEPMFK
ncbi:MAG: hypothetical protein L3J59_12205 [Methylococcaceae bacterium]|nr:hypothetical protein [Methylococcaceae bacterium]